MRLYEAIYRARYDSLKSRILLSLNMLISKCTPGYLDKTYLIQSTLNLQAVDEMCLEIRFLSYQVFT